MTPAAGGVVSHSSEYEVGSRAVSRRCRWWRPPSPTVECLLPAGFAILSFEVVIDTDEFVYMYIRPSLPDAWLIPDPHSLLRMALNPMALEVEKRGAGYHSSFEL